VLEAGKIRLAYEGGAFFLCYYEARLPVAPCTYPAVLEHRLADPAAALGEGHAHLQELRSILTALRHLPLRNDSSPANVVERGREKEVVKRRLAALCAASPAVRAAIDAAVRAFNGTVGDPGSFDLLDALISRQAYRLAYWRGARGGINYPPLFLVNQPAALPVRLPGGVQPTPPPLIPPLGAGTGT